MDIQLLSNGKYVGVELFEITSFPMCSNNESEINDEIKKNNVYFQRMLEELHKLAHDSNTSIELIWKSEEVENQVFRSKIRLFCVTRKLSDSKLRIEIELAHICDNIINSLSTRNFVIKKDILQQDIYSNKDFNQVFAVIKREKCNMNSNSIIPYYYTDIVPGNNSDNFEELISSMSQQKNCMVSIQIIPTYLTDIEKYYINELSMQLRQLVTGIQMNNQIYSDASATEPFKIINYYNEKKESNYFLYNVLVVGTRESCINVAPKLISLLKCGNNAIGNPVFDCIDISSANINFDKQFMIYPWNINNNLLYRFRNQQFINCLPLARELQRLPYLMIDEELCALFRLPLYQKGMVAIKPTQISDSIEQFDVSVVSKDNIQFGVLNTGDDTEVTIGCPPKQFTKHALIVGTPGSGKTTFSVNLLLQFYEKSIPFLAIEPTKSEYRAMIDAVPELQIFTPGNNTVSPFIINPFIPPKGITVEQYIPSLSTAFNAAFSMPTPLDVIFLKAIRSCYIEYGWKDYSKYGDKDVKVFGLYEFILVFKKLLGNLNYSKEVKGNLESGGLLRLSNLIEQNANIYDTIHTVPLEDVLSKPTVLELNAIDNEEQKALIMALLLINICLYTKHNVIGDGEIKNVILIDEAHVLLAGSGKGGDNASSQDTTIKALQNMIAEIRSYGTSIIIADQAPSKVSSEVVANTDIKIVFRLVETKEREIIGNSTNMADKDVQKLSTLGVGESYVFFGKLETPQLIKTEDIRKKKKIRLSVPNDEVAERSIYWIDKQDTLKPFNECKLCKECENGCDFRIRSDSDYFANKLFAICQKTLKDNESFKRIIVSVPVLLEESVKKCTNDEKRRLFMCTKIKLIRKIQLETAFKLTPKEIRQVVLQEG